MIRVCCVVRKDDKVLLVNRKGKWFCPGFLFDGKMYVAEIVKHFMKTKHNLSVKVGGIIDTCVKNKEIIYFIKIAEFSGKVKNAQWVCVKDIWNLNMDSDYKDVIRKILNITKLV